MSKRSIEIKVRLNKKEMETLNKRVKKSGLSREGYLRHLINGSVPRDAMMRELYRIGNSLNQIARKANTLNVIDIQRYDVGICMFEAAVKKITAAVVEPKPIIDDEWL